MRTRAGLAHFSDCRVDLNPRLLARHPAQIHECLAHELAHLVVRRWLGPREPPHGEAWRALMERAGYAPETVHTMDVRGLARKRRTFWYLHRCERCGQTWLARKTRRDLVCVRCGPGPVRVLRGPRSVAGLARLEAEAAAAGGRGVARRQAQASGPGPEGLPWRARRRS